jgi:hypothetical protein
MDDFLATYQSLPKTTMRDGLSYWKDTSKEREYGQQLSEHQRPTEKVSRRPMRRHNISSTFASVIWTENA